MARWFLCTNYPCKANSELFKERILCCPSYCPAMSHPLLPSLSSRKCTYSCEFAPGRNSDPDNSQILLLHTVISYSTIQKYNAVAHYNLSSFRRNG